MVLSVAKITALLYFSGDNPAVKLKPIIKAKISGKLVTSGISFVTIVSVHSEKTRLKKMTMIIIVIITEKPFTSK